MNADVLVTKVIEGIAVITLGGAKRIYFDAEMGDGLQSGFRHIHRSHSATSSVSSVMLPIPRSHKDLLLSEISF